MTKIRNKGGEFWGDFPYCTRDLYVGQLTTCHYFKKMPANGWGRRLTGF